MGELTVTKRKVFPSKSLAVKARAALLAEGVPCGTIRFKHTTCQHTFLHWHSGPKVNYA